MVYKTYRNYLKKRFGGDILKVPVNAGFSCNNKKDGAGCTFCDNLSFSPAALKSQQVVDQFVKVRDRSKRYVGYIPYLQPNTNTFGTVEELRAIYEPLLAQEGVVGLAVGTRPDALPDDVVEYLADVNARTYLSLEIGIQTSSDRTLARIKRGHDFACFADAVTRCAERGIEIVAHLMVGLPGEGRAEAAASARALSALPVQGVKIHQCMVIDNTEMAEEYRAGEFDVLTLEEYADIVGDMLENLREDILIHRTMADSKPEFGLIAPLWSAEKDGSMIAIRQHLENRGVVQGSALKGIV